MLNGDPVVERLNGEIGYLKDAVIPALRQEYERMRAALQEISDYYEAGGDLPSHMGGIAREALNGQCGKDAKK
jgi:hypothetical protein